jgi:hypothetical protein
MVVGIPPATIWTSDDGPILGLAASADRIFCVTANKLTSMARDGSDVRVLAQASALTQPSGAIAIGAATVYWGGTFNPGIAGEAGVEVGEVWAVPRDRGAATTIGSEGYVAEGIAVDGSGVYWLTDDAVMGAPLDGGAAVKLTALQGLSYENDFVLSAGSLYWSTNGADVGSPRAGLFQMETSGGTPVAIGSGPVFDLQPTPTGIAWLEDPTPVIVERASSPSLLRLPLSGWVDEFTTDGTRWYWRDDRTGAVYMLGSQDTTPNLLAGAVQWATANNGDGPHIVVDGDQLIWADRTGPIAYQPEFDVLRAIPVPPTSR